MNGNVGIFHRHTRLLFADIPVVVQRFKRKRSNSAPSDGLSSIALHDQRVS
jgi:hypothetical protein